MNKFKSTSLKIRIISAIVFLIAIVAALPTEAKKKGEAKIHFTEDIHDFGKVSAKGGKVSHEFIFTNAGQSNLVITDAKADCGCTKPAYSEEPVAPGKAGKLKVTFLPSGKGYFTKKVTVTTNGTPRKARLLIKGEVTD